MELGLIYKAHNKYYVKLIKANLMDAHIGAYMDVHNEDGLLRIDHHHSIISRLNVIG